MAGPGLPSHVADPTWDSWLDRFPPVPAQTLGEALRYQHALLEHLANMPDQHLLDPLESRRVGDDLAHYCRILQGAQQTSLRDAWVALGISSASLVGKMYFPGAELLLLAVAAGAGVIALGRVYDIKRRERIINRLIQRIDDLSWALKR